MENENWLNDKQKGILGLLVVATLYAEYEVDYDVCCNLTCTGKCLA